MSRQTLLLAIACALGGATLASLLANRDREVDEAEVTALQRRLATVEGRVAAAQRAPQSASPVPRMEQAPEASPVAPDADAAILPQGALPEELAALFDPQVAAERRRREAGVLEQVLAAEQVDAAATQGFAQAITQAFNATPELAGNQLLDAQCRESLCRIAVLHRSLEDVDAFLGSLGSLPGFENTETYWQREPNADGSSVMTMYVAREGHAMPDYQGAAQAALADDGS